MLSKFHSTHAHTLHACAVEEQRFVTERKKKKNEAEFEPRALPSESPSKKNSQNQRNRNKITSQSTT